MLVAPCLRHLRAALLADPDATAQSYRDGGLSDFGREIVAEMNRVGILCDLSHVGPRTSEDVILTSKQPVAYTHCLPAGLKEADRLPEPLFTPSTKAVKGHDENIPFRRVVDLVGLRVAEEARDQSREQKGCCRKQGDCRKPVPEWSSYAEPRPHSPRDTWSRGWPARASAAHR